MTTIQIFDPAMCCSSGICGVDVDQALIEFAADVDWLKTQGVVVERFNLAQQPQAFAGHAAIRELLHAQGETALPIILADGEIRHRGLPYPRRGELGAWAGVAATPSIFTEQVGELVAIGAAIASNCEPCYRFHFDRARRLDVSLADIRRTVDLAQRVKETPARAVLDLARRSLEKPPVAAPSMTVVAGSSAPEAGRCCGNTTAPAAQATTKCC